MKQGDILHFTSVVWGGTKRACDVWCIMDEWEGDDCSFKLFLGDVRDVQNGIFDGDDHFADGDVYEIVSDDDVPDHVWAALAAYRLGLTNTANSG